MFEPWFYNTCIDFFFEDEFKVIIWIELVIADEIKVVQRAHKSGSELFKLLVNAFFEFAESNIELNMTNFIEINEFDRTKIGLLFGRSFFLFHILLLSMFKDIFR